MSFTIERPRLGLPRSAGSPGRPPTPASAADELAKRGDKLFFAGCLICGTWVGGPIGAPMLVYAMYLMRKAEKAGAQIRPWAITIIGGLLLVDGSVNFMAWSLDMIAHNTAIGRTIWIDYGRMVDGGYANFYNTGPVGGVSVTAEKGVQFASCFLVMPMKIAAAWYLLRMKRFGLQWSIIANWLYFCLWAVYVVAMSLEFPVRFGSSEFGVLGFWLIGGIPFTGPVVILPFLHTVNKQLFTD
jgi:hypothetical protein